MPGRKYSADGAYRYGFNGKENDNEVKGEGNQQDYGMRIYDPRLGRFLSVDPIAGDYAMLTPYQFASNSPVDGIDLDGLELISSKHPKISPYLQYDPELKKITSVTTALIYQNFTGMSRSKLLPAYGPAGANWQTYEGDLLINFAEVKFEDMGSDEAQKMLVPTLTAEDQLRESDTDKTGNRFTYSNPTIIHVSKKHRDDVTRNNGYLGNRLNTIQFDGSAKLGAAVTIVGLVAVGIASLVSYDEFVNAKRQSNFIVGDMAEKINEWLPKIPEQFKNDNNLTEIARYLLNGEVPMMTTLTGSVEVNKELLKIGQSIWDEIQKERKKAVLNAELQQQRQMIDNRLPADNTRTQLGP